METTPQRQGITERAVAFHGRCLDVLRAIPTGTVQLVVTSPPCNIGKEYEHRLKLGDYIAQQRVVIQECARVLRGIGSIWRKRTLGYRTPHDVYFGIP